MSKAILIVLLALVASSQAYYFQNHTNGTNSTSYSLLGQIYDFIGYPTNSSNSTNATSYSVLGQIYDFIGYPTNSSNSTNATSYSLLNQISDFIGYPTNSSNSTNATSYSVLSQISDFIGYPTNSSNSTNCTHDVIKFKYDVETFYNTSKILVNLTIIPAFQNVTRTCLNLTDPYQCFENVIQLFNYTQYVAQYVMYEVKDVIIPDIQNMTHSCFRYEEIFSMALSYFGDSFLQQEEENVLEQPNDWAQCMEDINKIVSLVNQIQKDIKRFKFKDLVKHVRELQPLVTQAIQDCKK